MRMPNAADSRQVTPPAREGCPSDLAGHRGTDHHDAHDPVRRCCQGTDVGPHPRVSKEQGQKENYSKSSKPALSDVRSSSSTGITAPATKAPKSAWIPSHSVATAETSTTIRSTVI